MEIWGGLRLDPLVAFDVGGQRYVVEVRLWGKGKRSGVEVDQRFAFLYTLRQEDDKIIRAQVLPDVGVTLPVGGVTRLPDCLIPAFGTLGPRHRTSRRGGAGKVRASSYPPLKISLGARRG